MPIPLDDKLIYHISMAQQVLKAFINNSLKKSNVRITHAQAGIILLLADKRELKMSELGQLLGIENSAITQLVDRLEDARFVQRRMDPNDRRALLISATPEGKAEAEKAKSVIRKVNKEIKSGHSSADIEVFKSVLGGILEKFKKQS